MLKIAAISYVSLSEIQTVANWVTEEFIEENPEIFKKMLFDLGMDVYNYPWEVQNVTHRNRFGNTTPLSYDGSQDPSPDTNLFGINFIILLMYRYANTFY